MVTVLIIILIIVVIIAVSRSGKKKKIEIENLKQEQGRKSSNVSEELARLKQLKEQGVLTEGEFQAQKKKLLG